MSEVEACVGGAEALKGLVLVREEEMSGPGDGGQSYRHHPFENFRHGLE